MPGETMGPKPRSTRAWMGVAIAVAGALSAAHPDNEVVQRINIALPQLADVVPALITACGALIAAFAHPPRMKQ
jgi:hypothetical protein